MKTLCLFDDAFSALCEHIPTGASEWVHIDDAIGRTLAAPVVARIPVPPFSRAMMDGFAIRYDDIELCESTFHIRDVSRPGHPFTGRVSPGEAIRIMTGSPMPEGADTVVRYEWCTELGDGRVRIDRLPPARWESVQARGDDARQGEELLKPGTQLFGLEVAVCRAFGVARVLVVKQPSAAILVTGDELVKDIESELALGQIYGINEAFIGHALATDGYAVGETLYLPDNRAVLRQTIASVSQAHDVVVITGGASAGDYDYVPDVIRDLGADVIFERVWMRPGSPMVFARLSNTAIFCLSGNPAASFVQFETLVRPALRRSLGIADVPFPSTGKLTSAIELKPTKHTHIFRAYAWTENGEVLVDANFAQSSGVISSLAKTNCLIRLDEPAYEAGDVVSLRWFRQPGTK
jgi:molybdopterin molybdotransferase